MTQIENNNYEVHRSTSVSPNRNRNMKLFSTHSIVGLLAAAGLVLAGCQSTTDQKKSTESAKSKSPVDRCEKAKKAWNYNTPDGRMVAWIVCTGNTDSMAAWREHTRQRTCQAQTGELCKD
ncbi:hypothetical protein [Roseibium sp. SCP14]|uniref:hypothetical protein n=1 Tax=Roseibium sp. SCP14 TaxID=3141375 RepID=UPI0033389CD6